MPARRSEDLRERILSELVRLTATRGLAGVAIQDVADACHTTKQVVLYHFSSRDSLQAAMVDWIVDDANQALLSVIRNGTGEGPTRVESLLATTRALVEGDPLAAAVALRVLLDADPPLRRRLIDGLRPWRQYVADQISHAVREGQVRQEVDVEAFVWVLAGMVMSSVAMFSQDERADADPERVRERTKEELFRSIWHLLTP